MNTMRREKGDIKKNTVEVLQMKNIIFEIKISLVEINSRLDITEEKISEVEDTVWEAKFYDGP